VRLPRERVRYAVHVNNSEGISDRRVDVPANAGFENGNHTRVGLDLCAPSRADTSRVPHPDVAAFPRSEMVECEAPTSGISISNGQRPKRRGSLPSAAGVLRHRTNR
jgi:hypothetical protein